MRDVVLHVEAAEEMQSVAAYYESRAPGLGEEFLDEVEHGLHRIEQFPQLWPVYDDDYRRYLPRRFPHGLIYRLTPDRIFVIAVAHLKKEPNYWQGRR